MSTGFDLCDRGTDQTLNAAAADRREPRVDARRTESICQQCGGIRIVPDATQNPDRVHCLEERRGLGVFGRETGRAFHQLDRFMGERGIF